MSISPVPPVTMSVMPATLNKLLGGPITDRYQESCPFKNLQNNAFTKGIEASTFLRGIELPASAFTVDEHA